ncbi:MAG: acyl-CoA thioesterase [Chitinophagales bacterium]
MGYFKSYEIRWADIDPNNHVVHSKYYEFGAAVRISYFIDHGITMEVMRENGFGPILFREECLFKKEIRFGDTLTIDIQLSKSKKDFSRWSMQHNLYIRENSLAAQIFIDGAWIDTKKRKLAFLPEGLYPAFEKMPKTENFSWL